MVGLGTKNFRNLKFAYTFLIVYGFVYEISMKNECPTHKKFVNKKFAKETTHLPWKPNVY